MTPHAADIVGLSGGALFVAAFIYANYADKLDKLWFNLINLVAAALLLVSLWVNFNLAAFVLEAVWAAIALIGLISALRARRAEGAR